jgi:hypothetical protein
MRVWQVQRSPVIRYSIVEITRKRFVDSYRQYNKFVGKNEAPAAQKLTTNESGQRSELTTSKADCRIVRAWPDASQD